MRMILLLGFMFFAGCSLFVAKPEIAVKGVNLSSIDGTGVEMDLLLAVTNNNSYSLKLTGYNYSLILSDLPLARGDNRDVVEFKAKTTTDVRLPVRIPFNDLLEILKRRPDPEHIPYQLQAGFDLQTPFGAISVPVQKSGSFAVPRKFRPDQFLKQFNDILNRNSK